MLNTSVILLILLHRSLPWCLLSGNGFGVPTRMWHLSSYGSSYVTQLCYVCLTYHVVLSWILMRVSMLLELYYCRNTVMGCILWLSTLQSTIQLNITMGLGTRSCLLLYKHVQSGYHQKSTLIMSLIIFFMLSHFFHVVRLTGWSG